MNASLRLLLTVTALAAPVVAAPAMAADYDPPVIVDQPVEEVPVEIGSGWYLRGDIGYNFSTKANGDFTYRTFDPTTGAYSPAVFDTAATDDNLTFGVGVGYNFTDMFRADATVDAFQVSFDGSTSSAAPCIDPALNAAYAGTGCRSTDSSSGVALSMLLNGYVDLGTYVGFTPYVGGGVGYTYVNWDNLASNTYCTGTCPSPPGAFIASSESQGEHSWRFTYALMAGLAYDVSKNMKFDLGYRYRHIDGGSMFQFDPATMAAGASGTQGSDPGFDTHEVRLGLRYSLW